MKVLFVLINMNIGGTEKALLNLLEVLPTNYQVDILLLEKKGGFLNEIPKRIKVLEFEHAGKINVFLKKSPHQVVFDLFKRRKIREGIYALVNYLKWKLIKDITITYKNFDKYVPHLKQKYDIAISYAGPHDFISYYVVNKVKATRKIQWIHFDVSKLGGDEKFGDKYYNYFSKILCVSHSSANSMRQKYPKLKERINVFENIILKNEITSLIDLGDSYSDDFKGVRLCTLGRLSHEKGQFMIPLIVKRLKDLGYNFRWYCIGEGGLRKRIESEIERLDIKNELILLGLKKNPYRFLKDSDIYVQTSLHEGYGLTMREAKVINVPMVVTNVASASEIIEHGKTGVIVDINEDSLFKGVRKMLDEEQLLLSIKKNLIREGNLENNIDINSKINRLLIEE